MNGKRVFVSGGAGVIGLEMIPRLLDLGATVLVGDLKPRPGVFPAELQYRQGDLNTISKGELEAFAPDMFIHLAATFERSSETCGFWEENFWHNVRLSHHLMTIAKDLRSLKRVVFASSYLIYQPSLYQFDTLKLSPISLRETDPVLPRNLIGMAKLAHEIELRFLESFCSNAFTTICARIYRGYGRNSRDVISRWIRSLLAGEPISIYRPEGRFDYIYAKDSAEGLIRLAEADSVSGVINLGTGLARSVQEVVSILRAHFPDMQTIEEVSDIPYEASQADTTLLRAAIGWVPEYKLERAIPEIIAHEKVMRLQSKKPKQVLGNVLITSGSRKVPMVRAAQDAARKLHPAIRVFAGDLDDQVLTRYFADGFWRMPRAVDSEVDVLLAGCHERGIQTIIPTRDGELLFWAQNQQRFFAQGINVIISPHDSVLTCIDKLAFAQFGLANDLPVIPTSQHPDEVGAGPYVVKERCGAGSRLIGLNLDRRAALEHGEKLESPIYQPFITGTEVSIDAWLDQSHLVKGMVLRTRDKVVDGESQVTTTFRDDAIESLAARILLALKLKGPVVMQGLIDPHKAFHVVECNARFGGASTISIAAGLDSLYWSMLETQGVDAAEYPFDRALGEIRQVRIPCDIHLRDNNI